MDNKITAEGLRKIATELRNRSEQRDHDVMSKSAQVLLAAKGIQQLQQVLRGDDPNE
jgi:hypothetical protein